MNEIKHRLFKAKDDAKTLEEQNLISEYLERLSSYSIGSIEYSMAKIEALKFLNNPEDIVELHSLIKKN